MNIIITSLLFLFGVSIICMFIFNYLASKYQQRTIKRHLSKRDNNFRKKPPPSNRDNDFLSRDKVGEKKKDRDLQFNASQQYQYEASQENEISLYDAEKNSSLTKQNEETTIVGIAKPVGKWSQFVMKQKLGFLIAMSGLQNKDQKGYWVNLIKAQDISQDKNQQKGR